MDKFSYFNGRETTTRDSDSDEHITHLDQNQRRLSNPSDFKNDKRTMKTFEARSSMKKVPASHPPSHLKSFMFSNMSSDSDNEGSRDVSHDEDNSATSDDAFPMFQSKRKRSYSSSSGEDSSPIIRTRVLSRTSNSSGTIKGTFGRQSYTKRSKFPSDDALESHFSHGMILYQNRCLI